MDGFIFGVLRGLGRSKPARLPDCLMGAIMEGRTEIARMLTGNGANVNATMAFGIMPLMGAAMEDDAEIVQVLLDKGADVNAKSIMNKTALIGCGAKTALRSIETADTISAVLDFVISFGTTEVIQRANSQWSKNEPTPS